MFRCIAAAMCVATLLPLHAAADELHMIALVDITVAPDGAVTDATLLRPELPPAVRDVLQSNARALRFEPIRIDGAPASVSTTVSMSTCITDRDGGVAVATDVRSVGPNPVHPMTPPITPEMIREVDRHMAFALEFTVQSDGTASFDSLALPRMSARGRRAFEKPFSAWIESMRFVPERVDGQPVASRMEWPISITTGDRHMPAPDAQAAEGICARARQEPSTLPRLLAGSERLRLREPG